MRAKALSGYTWICKMYFLALTSQFLHPEASFFPSGDQAIANIQCL